MAPEKKQLKTKEDYLNKLLESVELLTAIKKNNEEQNQAIDLFIESLIQEMQEGKGSEEKKEDASQEKQNQQKNSEKKTSSESKKSESKKSESEVENSFEHLAAMMIKDSVVSKKVSKKLEEVQPGETLEAKPAMFAADTAEPGEIEGNDVVDKYVGGEAQPRNKSIKKDKKTGILKAR